MLKFNIESTLVVFPARGGSKRIPDKNIKEIFGQPMIYWPLMEIQKIFNRENVLISTDSKSIKSVVQKKGLDVPFLRPDNLSDDFTGTTAVIEHALKWYEDNIKKVEYVLTVYPTAVLLREEDIISSMKMLLEDDDCDSVMSATSFSFPIQRAIFENNKGYAEMFQPENHSKRSQDFAEAKHDAGQFYLSRANAIRNSKSLINANTKLLLLHRNNVVDIDSIEDFEVAEQKLKTIKRKTIDPSWSF